MDDSPATQSDLKRAVATGMVVSVAAKGIYLASRFFLPPLILARISLEEYGLWSTCFILIGYLGMTTFGVSSVYTRWAAVYQARREPQRIAELFATGVTVTAAVGALALAGVAAGLPWLLAAFKVSPALQRTGFLLILGTAAIFVLDLSLGAVTYVLHGLQKVGLANGIWLASVSLETVLIVVFLQAGLGVWGLLLAFALRYALSLLASWIACRRLGLELSLSPRLFRREHLRLFAGYGSIVQVSGLLSMFLRSVEKLIAGFVLGVEATGLMDLGEKLPSTSISIPSSMNAALLPAAAQLQAEGRGGELRRLYLRGARYVSLVAGLTMGFLASFASPIMAAWIGSRPDLAVAAAIMAIFALPWHLHVVTGPASSVFRGTGQPVRELAYPVAQLLLVALAVPAGFAVFDRSVLVISVTVAAAMVVSALGYTAWANSRLGVGQMEFFRTALLPGLLPYAVGGGLRLLASPLLAPGASRLATAALVCAFGAAYALAAPACFLAAQCDANERDSLLGEVRRHAGGVLGRLGLRAAPVAAA